VVCPVRRERSGGADAHADTQPSRLDRRDEELHAEDVHDPGEIIGEHVQGHLGGNLRQALHLKVRRTHPHLERTEGMLDCLAAHAHRLRVLISRLCSTDYAAAERFWSDRYIQHSAHIAPGRAGLFDRIRTLPEALRYENQLIVAEGDYVIAHGHFSGNGRPAAWIAADVIRFEVGKLAEHWDVLQDEATQAESVSGLPMFGNRFPA
jgi:predicted SnoaL-like aldol condensation-catalyzing enzyme